MLSQQSKEALRVLGVEKRAEETYIKPDVDVFFSQDSIDLLSNGRTTSRQIIELTSNCKVPMVVGIKVANRLYGLYWI